MADRDHAGSDAVHLPGLLIADAVEKFLKGEESDGLRLGELLRRHRDALANLVPFSRSSKSISER